MQHPLAELDAESRVVKPFDRLSWITLSAELYAHLPQAVGLPVKAASFGDATSR